MPSFHGAFTIPTPQGVSVHQPEFAESARTDAAHIAAIKSAKGMALLAIKVLQDEEFARDARAYFERYEEK